jgi:small-conductance mechanosensitive channel
LSQPFSSVVPLAALVLLCWLTPAPAQDVPQPEPQQDPEAAAEPESEAPAATPAEPEPDSEPIAEVIEAEEDAQPSDTEIKTRLEEIFGNLPSLQRVSVTVSDGVIMLGGSVDDLDASERAEQLAERVTGAVIVVNNITRDRSIGSRLAAATRSIQVRLKDLAGSSPLLLLALTVVAFAVFLARLVGKARWIYARVAHNWFIRDLLRQIVQLVIVVAGIVIALQLLDATALLGSIFGALGILGLAVGFATRDTVENYIASILLSLRQPFEREDHIDIDGTEGKVMRLTSRATVLMSIDGNHVRIPNAKVYKSTIVNYTRNPLRRIDFDVGVDTDVDLGRPRAVAVDAVAGLPGVLESPAAACLVETLGDSRVMLRVYVWIDQRESDYLKLKSEAQRLVKEAFDEAGIVMPEPIYNIKLRGPSKRVGTDDAKARPTEAAPPDTVTSTAPDRSIDRQMQSERRDTAAEDLLNKAAPRE